MKNVTPIVGGTVYQCVLPSSQASLKELYFSEKASLDPNAGLWIIKECWSIDSTGIIFRHNDMTLFGVPNIISSVAPPEWWNRRPRIVV